MQASKRTFTQTEDRVTLDEECWNCSAEESFFKAIRVGIARGPFYCERGNWRKCSRASRKIGVEQQYTTSGLKRED